jgi:hypothetical protein
VILTPYFSQTRDDAAKKHPMLIPYEELSDTEKAYDLDMALETLKVWNKGEDVRRRDEDIHHPEGMDKSVLQRQLTSAHLARCCTSWATAYQKLPMQLIHLFKNLILRYIEWRMATCPSH